MCKLDEKTDLKSKKIYKCVKKIGERYYAVFSGLEILPGKVDPYFDFKKKYNEGYYPSCVSLLTFGWYSPSNKVLFNPNHIGKTSGFEDIEVAKTLSKRLYIRKSDYWKSVVLEMEIGGEIWKGNGNNIDAQVPTDSVVYAGTEIISYMEIEST